MSFDDDFDGPGYDECYDPCDDIYAGTAVCDDGSDQAYEDRHEGEDVEGEMGAGQDGEEEDEGDEEDSEPDADPHDNRFTDYDGYVD